VALHRDYEINFQVDFGGASMMDKFIIYGLIDPRTRLIRYVGKSSRGLCRPKQHEKCDPKTTGVWCRRWIKKLQGAGLTYEVVILDRGTAETLPELECFWISYGRACHWPLTNMTPRGDGRRAGSFVSMETRAKQSAAQKGRIFSEATRKAIGAAHKARYLAHPEALEALRNRTFTSEWRAKIGAKRKGHVKTAETLSKIREARRLSKTTKLSIDDAKEILSRLSTGERLSVLAKHFGVCHQTIANVKNGKTFKDAEAGNVQEEWRRNKFHLAPEQIAKIRIALVAGIDGHRGTKNIAKLLNVSRDAVIRVRDHFQIKPNQTGRQRIYTIPESTNPSTFRSRIRRARAKAIAQVSCLVAEGQP
jgi:hypothetical protein